MPIEGISARLWAICKTEAVVENSPLNDFANWTLWYVQYFSGRETIQQQGGRFILVEKADNSNVNSWTPAAIKTAAYFVLAAVFVIPGTIARLLSLDSPKVRAAVFADRVSPAPPPNTKDIPLPKPNPIPAEDPKKNEPQASDAPQPIIEPAKPDAFSSDIEYQYTVDILHEMELSIQFFADLSKKENDSTKLKQWLDKKENKIIYFSSFLFGHYLSIGISQNKEKVLKIIPVEDLSRWVALYTASCQKLETLGINPFLEGADAVSTELSQKNELNAYVKKVITFFCRFLQQKANAEQWLKKAQLEETYLFPFFNTLTWLGWKEGNYSLDPGNYELLSKTYEKVKTRLYEIKAEKYLKESPPNLSPGCCALVLYFNHDLTAAPPKASEPAVIGVSPLSEAQAALPASANVTLPVDDAQLKELFLKTMPSNLSFGFSS